MVWKAQVRKSCNSLSWSIMYRHVHTSMPFQQREMLLYEDWNSLYKPLSVIWLCTCEAMARFMKPGWKCVWKCQLFLGPEKYFSFTEYLFSWWSSVGNRQTKNLYVSIAWPQWRLSYQVALKYGMDAGHGWAADIDEIWLLAHTAIPGTVKSLTYDAPNP